MKKVVYSSILIVNFLFISINAQANSNLKKYEKYDFIAGEKIIFDDNLKNDKPSTQPKNWKVENNGGQAIISKVGNENAISITKYYTNLAPDIKKKKYLPNAYTIEFDYYLDMKYSGNPGVRVHFMKGDEVAAIIPNATSFYFKFPGGEVNSDTPAELKGDNFYDKWIHIAITYKNNQAKVYANQYPVLFVPKCNFKADSLLIKGDASEGLKMYFKNFKIAEGGEISTIDSSLKSGKFVTHNINFDVNKADIRPESMGVLNEVAKYLKSNSTVKFEIGGYTDSDGDDSSNIKLSQQRAEAVRNELVDMGVKSEQLTSKGYGEINPIGDNKTVIGKFNNRRVEFIKK